MSPVCFASGALETVEPISTHVLWPALEMQFVAATITHPAPRARPAPRRAPGYQQVAAARRESPGPTSDRARPGSPAPREDTPLHPHTPGAPAAATPAAPPPLGSARPGPG